MPQQRQQQQGQNAPERVQPQRGRRIAVFIGVVCGLSAVLGTVSSRLRLNSPSDIFNYKVDLSTGVKGNDNSANNSNTAVYCEWKHTGTLDACFDVLSRRLAQRDILPSRLPWVYFGDSTMKNMVIKLVPGLANIGFIAPGVFGKMELLRNSTDRCGLMHYFGFPAPNNDIDPDNRVPWIAPSHALGEGPIAYGKRHPFCSDAAGTRGRLHRFSLVPNSSTYPELTKAFTTIEYLPVEFSLDVSYPTKTTRTTQETALRYLRKQYQSNDSANAASPSSPAQQQEPPAICGVNTGVHDMAVPNITTSIYVHNVLNYWKLLLTTDDKRFQPACSHMIWVSTSATRNDERPAQKNYLIEEWNQALLDLFSPSTPAQTILTTSFLQEHITIVNVYDKSSQTPHVDNVHLDEDLYYKPFSDLFMNLTTQELVNSLKDE